MNKVIRGWAVCVLIKHRSPPDAEILCFCIPHVSFIVLSSLFPLRFVDLFCKGASWFSLTVVVCLSKIELYDHLLPYSD